MRQERRCGFLHATPGSRSMLAIGHDAGRELGLAIVARTAGVTGLPRAAEGYREVLLRARPKTLLKPSIREQSIVR